MMQKVCRAIVDRLKVGFGYFSECRGIFCVTNSDHMPLPGVQVSYRVGCNDWIPCGTSTSRKEHRNPETDADVPVVNFIQTNAIVYQLGEPVSWRFSKRGYATRTITRYTADMSFDETHNIIILHKHPSVLARFLDEPLMD